MSGLNLVNAVKKTAGISDGLVGGIEKAMLLVGHPTKQEEFHVMRVKYNPASIHMSTRAGSFQQPVMGSAVTQVTQMTVPAQTTFDVDLIFDAINNEDAFMLQKYTTISASGAVSKTSAVLNNLKGDGYSVQTEVEGLVSLMVNANTRKIIFCWADMAISGELVSVSVAYTMFNPIGNPIYAKVSLSIQQQENMEGTGYWEKSFDTLFKEATVMDVGGVSTSVYNANSKKDMLKNWVKI